MTAVQDMCAIVFGSPRGGIVDAGAVRFARGGLPIYAVGPDDDALANTVESVLAAGGEASALTADATDAAQVRSVFERVAQDGLVPALVLHAAGAMPRSAFLELTAESLQDAWRGGCLSGFLVGQAAIRAMLPRKSGTLIVMGDDASLRGEAGDAAHAAARSGLRIYAQAMAREFGPKGIHVAHVIADGKPGGGGSIDPVAVADACWDLHQQHRTAWSQEIDLRCFGRE